MRTNGQPTKRSAQVLSENCERRRKEKLSVTFLILSEYFAGGDPLAVFFALLVIVHDKTLSLVEGLEVGVGSLARRELPVFEEEILAILPCDAISRLL